MMTVIPRFNMRRVLFDYTRGLYQPAAAAVPAAGRRRIRRRAHAGGLEAARARSSGRKVSLRLLSRLARAICRAASALRLRVAAALERARSPPTCGWSSSRGGCCREADLHAAAAVLLSGTRARDGMWRGVLQPRPASRSDGATVFALDAAPQECGQFATEIRIYPWHELLSHPYELGLMKWL